MNWLQQLGSVRELLEAVEGGLIEIRESLDMHQFCAYWGAYDVLRYLRDCACIVHGTSGCLTSRRLLPTLGSVESCDLNPHYSTALNEHDVIFGGEKRLAVALREVEARHAPALIAVVTNCCADIIGDDIAGVIGSVPEVAEKTIWLHTGGFTGKSYRAGSEAAFSALAELMEAKPLPVQGGTVNLFVRRWIWGAQLESEIAEARRMLEKLGLQVRAVMRPGISVEDFLTMREAEANVSMCSFFASALVTEMQRRFGTKGITGPSPVGLTQTIAWMESVATATGQAWRAEDDEEVRELGNLRQQLCNQIGTGRHAIIWSQTGDRMISLARLAQDVGLTPILVGVDPAAVRDKISLFRREVDAGFDAPTAAAATIESVRELLSQLQDPIVFCNDDYFPEFPVFGHRHAQNTTYGFAGARLLYAHLREALSTQRSRYSLLAQVVPQ